MTGERVGPGAPPGQEDGETDSLEDLGSNVDADGVKRAPLRNSLDEDLQIVN